MKSFASKIGNRVYILTTSLCRIGYLAVKDIVQSLCLGRIHVKSIMDILQRHNIKNMWSIVFLISIPEIFEIFGIQ